MPTTATMERIVKARERLRDWSIALIPMSFITVIVFLIEYEDYNTRFPFGGILCVGVTLFFLTRWVNAKLEVTHAQVAGFADNMHAWVLRQIDSRDLTTLPPPSFNEDTEYDSESRTGITTEVRVLTGLIHCECSHGRIMIDVRPLPCTAALELPKDASIKLGAGQYVRINNCQNACQEDTLVSRLDIPPHGGYSIYQQSRW